MELAAIIVVGAHKEEVLAAGNNHYGPLARETFAGIPIALLDVVGKSVVHHVADRLRRAGVEAITALTPEALCQDAVLRDGDSMAAWLPARDLWRSAEDAFFTYAGEGAETVLLLRLGPYAEIDVAELMRFHLERRQSVTLVHDCEGSLDAALVQAARRNDAAFILRNGLQAARVPSQPYITGAYVNRLENASDLRRLAQDALLMRCEVPPAGREIKPGVWVGEHARIHRTARVLAPAFVGAHANLRAASVVTRCSAVEHHSEVDCGSVVEDSSVLPYTYLGADLDCAHTVIGFGKVAHLRRQAEVEVVDPRLLGTVTTSPSWRTLKNAASLAAYLPVQALRGLLQGGQRAQAAPLEPPPLNQALPGAPAMGPSSEPVSASNQFARDFAVVRRYGNE